MKFKIIIAATVTATLIGCGGGGGGDSVSGGGIEKTPAVNLAPVANAGVNQSAIASALVTLDGTASSDPNGDSLTYNWTLTSKPNGSAATLFSPNISKPTFTADVAGTYVVNLTVSDGRLNSAPSSTTIQVNSISNWPANTSPISVNRIGVQADGKVLAVGVDSTSGSRGKFAIKRLNADGSPDLLFGANGVVAIGLGAGNSYAHDVAIQDDNKIVAYGYTNDGSMVVVRYTATGVLDATFGNQGVAEVRALPWLSSYYATAKIFIQSDGKILTLSHGSSAADAKTYTIVHRLNTDGSIDASFGLGGSVIFGNSTSFTYPVGISVTSNGDIYVARNVMPYFTFDALNKSVLISRLKQNGSVDASFGANGTAAPLVGVIGLDGWAFVIQPDGKLLIAGKGALNPDTIGAIVVRLQNNGDLDTLFGNNGNAFFDLTAYDDFANTIAVDQSGRLLVSGLRLGPGGFAGSGFVMRLSSNGSVDPGYGELGIRTPSSGNVAYGFSLDSSGAVFVVTGDKTIEKLY